VEDIQKQVDPNPAGDTNEGTSEGSKTSEQEAAEKSRAHSEGLRGARILLIHLDKSFI
jgi:hypothetical protein